MKVSRQVSINKFFLLHLVRIDLKDFKPKNISKLLLKKRKILVIDDNKFITKSVQKLVELVLKDSNAFYEVITGYDGIEILNYIREDQANGNLIKLVISDENMEYLNGSEAIKIIRNWEKKGIIKPLVIFTSTCHEDGITTKLILESGSQILLQKPLNKSDLLTAFHDYNII